MKMVLESDIFELGALNPKDDLSIYFAGSENNAFDGKSELCNKIFFYHFSTEWT